VNEAALSLSELAKIARDEQARLERIGDVHPREEFEHHVWPFLNELLANVQQTLDSQEAMVPAELAGHIAAACGQLIGVAAKVLSADELAPIAAVAHEAFDELLGYVDADEWARLVEATASEPVSAGAPVPATLTDDASVAASEAIVSSEVAS
jgi:hypothetical protein